MKEKSLSSKKTYYKIYAFASELVHSQFEGIYISIFPVHFSKANSLNDAYK